MKAESQAILQQLTLTAKHRQLLRNRHLLARKKKNAARGVSLTAVSAGGYAPLDLRPLPWGAYRNGENTRG